MSDTIYRQEAIIAASEACAELRGVFERCEDALNALPSAQPKRRMGKWNTYYHGGVEFSYSCNQCGYSAPYYIFGGEHVQKKTPFCPICGAEMEKSNDI